MLERFAEVGPVDPSIVATNDAYKYYNKCNKFYTTSLEVSDEDEILLEKQTRYFVKLTWA